MSEEEFIDLCILLGCDYCDKIRGLGPKSAIKLIQDHKSIEEILKRLDKKHTAPENWQYKVRKNVAKSF